MKSKTTLLTQICQIALITGMLLSTSMLSAQSMQDTVIANFSLLEQIPHEKVYLHLDKPFYGAGEKIWFKGYLINAITHQDDSQSNFIITELINRSDSIVERKKIRKIFGCLHAMKICLIYRIFLKISGRNFFYTLIWIMFSHTARTAL